MKITNQINEYIIQDGDTRYSVKHNIKENYLGIWRIEENPEIGDRNSVVWFDVPEELIARIKETINYLDKSN